MTTQEKSTTLDPTLWVSKTYKSDYLEKKITKFLNENQDNKVQVFLSRDAYSIDGKSVMPRGYAWHIADVHLGMLTYVDGVKVWRCKINYMADYYKITFIPHHVIKKTKVKIGTYKSNQEIIFSASVWAVSTAIESPTADLKCKCRLRYSTHYTYGGPIVQTVDVDVTNRKFFYKGKDITSKFINANEVFDNLKLTTPI